MYVVDNQQRRVIENDVIIMMIALIDRSISKRELSSEEDLYRHLMSEATHRTELYMSMMIDCKRK